MEIALGIIALYLVFKLNSVLTTSIKIVNKSTELADESVEVYATDVRVNLAKKRLDQMEELNSLEYIPTSEDINSILAGKTVTAETTKSKDDI